MTLNIRKAVDSDADAVKALVFDVLAEYGLAPDPDGTDQDLDAIEQHYHRNGGYFGVVEAQGSIVATLGIYRVDDNTCELRKMYTRPSQRGKGLGKALVEFAMSTARELGYRRMTLETATPLVEAIALYKKYGFVEYTPAHLAGRCDQAFETTL